MASGLCRCRRPALRRILQQQYRKRDARLSELMAAAAKCSDRTELERLIGASKYSLAGHLYKLPERDGTITELDFAEIYCRDGCTLEYLFKNGQVHSVVGYMDWPQWDRAVDLPRFLNGDRAKHA